MTLLRSWICSYALFAKARSALFETEVPTGLLLQWLDGYQTLLLHLGLSLLQLRLQILRSGSSHVVTVGSWQLLRWLESILVCRIFCSILPLVPSRMS